LPWYDPRARALDRFVEGALRELVRLLEQEAVHLESAPASSSGSSCNDSGKKTISDPLRRARSFGAIDLTTNPLHVSRSLLNDGIVCA